MVKSKTKRVFWGFFPLDYKAIETYLEEMTDKGWMLEKVGRMTAKFRAIEPQKLKFYVDVFKEGGPLTPDNTKEAEEYRDLCQQSGWNFITSQDYLQFFYAEEDEDPTPIQTDEALEQKIVESTLWRNELLSILGFSIVAIMMLIRYFPLRYKYLLSFVGVTGMLLFPPLFIIIILSTAYGLIRNLRARRNIKKGLAIEKPTLKAARRRVMVFHVPIFIIGFAIILAFIADSFFRPRVVAISLIGPVFGACIGLGLRYVIKKKAKDKKDGVLYVTLAILGVIFFFAIVNALLMSSDMGLAYKKDDIPGNYPIVTMADLLEGPQQGWLVNREFNPGMSPITPKRYNYSETRNINGKKERIILSYYRTIHPYFAEVIFNGVTEELKRGIKWRGMYVLTKDIIIDGKMKDLWNADDLALTKTRDEIIVRKGNIVVHLSGDIDFDDEHTRGLIIGRFFID